MKPRGISLWLLFLIYPLPYLFLMRDTAGFEPAEAQLSSSTKTGARQRQLPTSKASCLGSSSVEDSYVNMKGKRLNPLKTEEVKMVIKPRSKGTFIVKPRILYIDETGKYK